MLPRKSTSSFPFNLIEGWNSENFAERTEKPSSSLHREASPKFVGVIVITFPSSVERNSLKIEREMGD
jgi:hypothetical protein